MSSYRAGQPKSETRKPVRDGLSLPGKLGLLAAGSLLPMLLAPVANAQCTALDANNQPVPLNALTSDSVVTCTAVTAGENISVSPPTSGVTVLFLGAPTVTNSNFTLNGDNHFIGSSAGTTFDDVGFVVNGANGQIVLQGSGQSIAALATGTDSLILFNGGVWDTGIVRATGDGARIDVGANTTVTASGIPLGVGVLSGGIENNVYALSGTLGARVDGLLITDDGGSDTYYINAGAAFNVAGGGRGIISDAGGTGDLLIVSGTHNLNLDITGIDNLNYSGSNVDNLTFNGVGNLLALKVSTGTIGQIDISSMMDANGTINIGADGFVRYGASVFANPFSQSLTGSGEFWLDGATTQITGDNSAFSGTFRVTSTTFVGSNGNAFGTANVINDGNLLLFDVNLANEITGTGHITMMGNGLGGRSSLSGVNTYSGGTLVTNAGSTLALLNASAAGTGDVTLNGDTFLELDFGVAGGDFTNFVTGDGSLRKTGAGTLTVSNTANDYIGGTIIDAGVLRITDFDALGSGAIVANAGGALMYDYSGGASELFTTPFLTGDGQFIKAGSGTIVISNANTWTGGSQILAGRVGLNNGQGLGTGGIDIAQGAILGIGGITLANNVSGAGQIIKTASNTAVLTGTNTLTGGIIIQDGAIEVASGASLGSGLVDIQAGTSLLVSNTLDTTVAAHLQGAGSLVKSGAGRAELTGNNGLSGVVLVQGGTLAVGGTGTVGSATVDVSAGATLELAHSVGNATFDTLVSGAGRLVKTGASTITVTGANTYTGGTQVAAGTLRATDIASLGTGGVSILSGGTFELSNATSQTFANGLSGAGTFRKTGAGDLTFANAFSVGSLLVDAGRMRLNATMTGNATVGVGAILNGTGQVTGTLTNNGTVAPGNSIGTLNVQGNYVHNANAILEIEFDAGGIDLLNVSGTAQINGGTLRFVSLGGAEGTGGTFLNAAGGVTGQFGTIETVGAQLPLAVIYQPNAVIMAPSVLTARPSTFNSQALAASDTMMGFADSVSMQARRSGNGAWVEGFAANGSRDAAGQTLAYDHDTTGVSVGVRGQLSDRIDAGFAVGWGQGDISLGANGGGGQQDGMFASVFGSYRFDGASIGGGILYGAMDQSTVRNVAFNTLSASVSGETDSVLTGAFLSADTTFGQAGDWVFGGSAQASYVAQTQDGYAESGASPLRLTLPELTFETMGLEAGLSAGMPFTLGTSDAHIQFAAGLRHTQALDDRIIPVRFAASNAGVDLQGDAREHTSPFAGVDFAWDLGGNATLTAGYQGRFGDDERHEARVGMQVAF